MVMCRELTLLTAAPLAGLLFSHDDWGRYSSYDDAAGQQALAADSCAESQGRGCHKPVA